MAEEQPTFKVVDRRLFNADGTPRELSEEEKAEADRAASAAAVENAAAAAMPSQQTKKESATPPPAAPGEPSRPAARERAPRRTGGDPLDDPTSFLSLIMSLASNAAASLGMMPHPATGETGVDLQTAKHWIDVLGMLEEKTHGNLDEQEAQMIENLLADLRMQYVSFAQSPTPPPAKFSASDITGGK
jgi:Domain of unknown function (DUF1844)